jgi:hypothetical protein
MLIQREERIILLAEGCSDSGPKTQKPTDPPEHRNQWKYGELTVVVVNSTDNTKGTESTRYQMTNRSLKASNCVWCFTWVWNLVSRSEGRIQATGVGVWSAGRDKWA